MAKRVDTIQKYLPVRDTNSCWIWLGQRNADGYGRVYKAGKRHLAHRYMYELEVGPIPPGKLLRHTCDTAACCNPRHLIPGTDAENVQDMMRANRQAKGSRMHSAKLTEELVVEIRRLYRRGGVTGREMARRYGVTQSAMSKVLQGVTWRHVPMEEA